jgi:hypothetical protein
MYLTIQAVNMNRRNLLQVIRENVHSLLAFSPEIRSLVPKMNSCFTVISLPLFVVATGTTSESGEKCICDVVFPNPVMYLQ